MSGTSKGAHLAAVAVRWASDVSRIAERVVAPLLDLLIRLWLAGPFWASGMVKLQSWTTALYLSAHEYPVSWLDSVTATWLGETIEILCPPLLVFGLATRFAALPMLILSVVIQFSYQALDQHLFWAILFGWFLVQGCRADLARCTDRARHRRYCPPFGGPDHPLLPGAVAVERSRHQASAALLDRSSVLPVGRHEDQQLRHDGDAVSCPVGPGVVAPGTGRSLDHPP
jgi:uncharacterized membrane protein YphA (DoxX/SURF4 family)